MLAFIVVVAAIRTRVAHLGAAIPALDPIVRSPCVRQRCDAAAERAVINKLMVGRRVVDGAARAGAGLHGPISPTCEQ